MKPIVSLPAIGARRPPHSFMALLLVWASLGPVLLVTVLATQASDPGRVAAVLLEVAIGVYSTAVVAILRPHDLASSARTPDHERAFARFWRAMGVLLLLGYTFVLFLWLVP